MYKQNKEASNFPNSATYRTAYRVRSGLSHNKKGDNLSEVRVEHRGISIVTESTTSRKENRRHEPSPPKTHNGVWHGQGKRRSTERISRPRKNYAPEKGFISNHLNRINMDIIYLRIQLAKSYKATPPIRRSAYKGRQQTRTI